VCHASYDASGYKDVDGGLARVLSRIVEGKFTAQCEHFGEVFGAAIRLL
jgi:hypothetical protein